MDPESKPKKPRRERRSFTDEFKAGAVRLVLDQGGRWRPSPETST